MREFSDEFRTFSSIESHRYRIEYSSVIKFWLRFVQSLALHDFTLIPSNNDNRTKSFITI